MIVHAEPSRELIVPRATPAVCADALTRIPVAEFAGMAWTRDAIAACAALLTQAADGDRSAICRWVTEAGQPAGATARYSVLHALCDALMAQAFSTRGEIRGISAVVTRVESDVLAALASARRRDVADRVNDPQTTELAAGVAAMVRLSDRETGAHLAAVSGLARRIAASMGFGADAVATIGLAAFVHDVGNLGVRVSVLRKMGALEPDEWREVRAHAEIGARALEELPGLAFLAPIVRAVHERIDGGGYPDGLRGAEIPLAARVIAVADAFAAMTAPRAFRPPLAAGDAAAILAENAGTQFDADVVEATLRLLRFTRRSRRAIA